MRNIKLVLQYDGTKYSGWQRLGDTDKTIQSRLEQVLTRMTGTNTEVIGSGRTDAGVHALCQVANFFTADTRTAEEIKEYLNQYLPEDIAVTEVTEVHPRFHARHNAISKTYLYRIWNLPHPEPFIRKYSLHIPEPFLKVKAMKRAAEYLVGEHDFTSFASQTSKKKSNIRTINAIEFEKKEGLIEIRITGDGFLYNMVRIIIGTLLEVGLGKMQPEQVETILESGDRQKAGPTAPPQGLFLEDVKYTVDESK
jgi:tRNA pseudouridine38-40 synthase